jgi:hypothetical protein
VPQEIEIVQLLVSAVHADELVRVLQQSRKGYLGPPHCEGAEVLMKLGGGEVALVIRWASSAAHAIATGGQHMAPFLQAVGALAAGPPKLTRYIIAADGPVR